MVHILQKRTAHHPRALTPHHNPRGAHPRRDLRMHNLIPHQIRRAHGPQTRADPKHHGHARVARDEKVAVRHRDRPRDVLMQRRDIRNRHEDLVRARVERGRTLRGRPHAGRQTGHISYEDTFFHMCVIEIRPPTWAWFWVSQIAFDVFVVLLSLINAADRPRGLNVKLLTDLRRDGWLFYLALFSLRLMNLVLDFAGDVSLSSLLSCHLPSHSTLDTYTTNALQISFVVLGYCHVPLPLPLPLPAPSTCAYTSANCDTAHSFDWAMVTVVICRLLLRLEYMKLPGAQRHHSLQDVHEMYILTQKTRNSKRDTTPRSTIHHPPPAFLHLPPPDSPTPFLHPRIAHRLSTKNSSPPLSSLLPSPLLSMSTAINLDLPTITAAMAMAMAYSIRHATAHGPRVRDVRLGPWTAGHGTLERRSRIASHHGSEDHCAAACLAAKPSTGTSTRTCFKFTFMFRNEGGGDKGTSRSGKKEGRKEGRKGKEAQRTGVG
ncbi:hypothetical protein EVG20_g10578 [Dentipellis fragilis]|uniref:Uncharacterized protein n=1 Tax=Dentipellis fragilis TaxID=205917 RepID=A0A4Y9XUZ7_9AGAM|nr:hypothetical protein EVG20_g10578 [Dentipellis fragilis]